eukprot:3180243-Pleurochrysis_carterae.AAC.1
MRAQKGARLIDPAHAISRGSDEWQNARRSQSWRTVQIGMQRDGIGRDARLHKRSQARAHTRRRAHREHSLMQHEGASAFESAGSLLLCVSLATTCK